MALFVIGQTAQSSKIDAAAIAQGRAVRIAKSVARAADISPIVDDIKIAGAVSLRQIAAP